MRVSVFIALLVACGGSNKPSADPPPHATSSLLDCTKVADHVRSIVDASAPRRRLTPAAVRDMVMTRCKTDGWSDATKQCLHAITTFRDGRGCAAEMTDEQRVAIRTHARSLRADAAESTDDPDTDWVRHVVEE